MARERWLTIGVVSAATAMLLLDVARGAQGIGAAAMFAASLAILAHEFGRGGRRPGLLGQHR